MWILEGAKANLKSYLSRGAEGLTNAEFGHVQRMQLELDDLARRLHDWM